MELESSDLTEERGEREEGRGGERGRREEREKNTPSPLLFPKEEMDFVTKL